MVQRNHTFADAAYVALAEQGEEMHYKDLTRLVLERRYFVSKGKTPEQSLRSQISREISQKGEEARFVNLDQGIYTLSESAKAGRDEALITQVRTFGEAVRKEQGEEASPTPAPTPEASTAPAPAAEAPAAQAPAPSAPASSVKEDLADVSFIPVELAAGDLDEEDDFHADTFATAERDPVVYEAPSDNVDMDESSGEFVLPRPVLEEDSEQDFLSGGGGLADMTSREYEELMDELAPIVVPPHEGGAAEVARIPLGGRSVLIVKVVRRNGQAQIQFVEELESLIAGVVGRLLLTLNSDNVDDVIKALVHSRKVISASFVAGDEDGQRAAGY